MQTRIRSSGPIVSALALAILAALPISAQAQTPCPQPTSGCSTLPAPAEKLQPTPTSTSGASLWVAPRDASLRELLSQWAAKAGWQEPTWTLKPDEDFTLGARLETEGEFPAAVTELFEAFPAEAKLRVRLYTSNRLMIVEQAP